MKEDLMRRISVALDSDEGIASDPALQQELRASPDAQKYAKDLTRLGKWLGTWPLPEPDDAAFEALAQRIEQRLDESLSTMSDPTAAPVFDDDDALRDATANLLSSGEYRISDSAIQLIPEEEPEAPPPPPAPLSDTKPVSPIAKVTLSKARVPTIVEESAVDASSDPRSAELDIATLGAVGAPKKKKKRKKSATSTSGDRISIPTPKPVLGAPTMSPSAPVVQMPRAAEERKPATLWWFAAAAAVGLGVFGAATLFDTQGSPAIESRSSAHGSTLVTSGAVVPTAAAVAPATPPPAPPPTLPPPSTIAQPAEAVADLDMQRAPARARVAASPASSAPRGAIRIAPTSGDDVDGTLAGALGSGGAGGGGAAHHAARSGSVGVAGPSAAEGAPTTTAPSAAPRPTPAPAEQARGDLPSTPDRSTIQAVLAARADAVSACANGAHGLADVDIVISGSGRITTATVNGTFAGTPIGSCIARAVRAATFPPFTQPRFQVTYPYHL